MDVNEKQKLHLIPKIQRYFKGNLKGKHFALWGLAFKPNTDDIREAPALYMIDALVKEGATVTVFDPEAMNNVKPSLATKSPTRRASMRPSKAPTPSSSPRNGTNSGPPTSSRS
jgi:UDP-glucose 6-dehydrogenase